MGKIADEIVSGGGSAERIQDDIRHTETEMTGTINEIEERLSPAHLKEKAFADVKRFVSNAMGQVRQAVRQNPVPFAVAGAGVILLGTRRLARARGRSGDKPAEQALTPPPMGEVREQELSPESSFASRYGRQFNKQDYFMVAALGVVAGAALALLPIKQFPTYEGARELPVGGLPVEETGPLIK